MDECTVGAFDYCTTPILDWSRKKQAFRCHRNPTEEVNRSGQRASSSRWMFVLEGAGILLVCWCCSFSRYCSACGSFGREFVLSLPWPQPLPKHLALMFQIILKSAFSLYLFRSLLLVPIISKLKFVVSFSNALPESHPRNVVLLNYLRPHPCKYWSVHLMNSE